ncbi:hypothetical protein DSO57_1030671 [Entomophthora muscae]|uniref:Uncharacterized protein n=1 Tax=Entomophthora muscae TaxID=34485 RepID=A0ACC2UMW1_9FUNG|nr:hypothetical protein DSO57_1030671 [Entomophthora muscae]
MIVLFNRKPSKRWEMIYWVVSTTLPLAINIPVLVAGIFGKNPYGNCAVIRGTKVNDIIAFVYNVGFSSITITYCLVIAMLVICKVKKETYNQTMESLTNTNALSDQIPILSLKSLICRTCMYPSSFFLAYFGSNIALTYEYIFKSIPMSLVYWARFGYCSRGILHLFSFLADPIVGQNILNIMSSNPGKCCSQSKMVQENENSSQCGFSYETLISPSSQDVTPCLRDEISKFLRFI